MAALSRSLPMELESGEEREDTLSAEFSDDDRLEAILNQDGLPLDQISSIPSSRFSGEIATLRRDWEHVSDIVSEHQWAENEEDECTPNYVSEMEDEISNSVFHHDTYSDESGGVVNDSSDSEDDGGENDGGEDRAIELSYCELEEKDDLISQLQEQLRREQADKLHAADVNKSLQREYERVRKRLAECEMHIDRLRLAPSVDDMVTKTITLVYEDMNLPIAAAGDVVGLDPLPTTENVASLNCSPTSGVMVDSKLVPSRSRTPDGGPMPPAMRPGTQQQNYGTPPAVKATRKRDREGRESLNLLPMDVACPTHCPVQDVRVSCSEEGTQTTQEKVEEVPFASECVDQNGCTMHQGEGVVHSLQDGEVEDSVPERRADDLVADLLSLSSFASTSVLQLVSEMSNCGSVAGFLAEETSDVLPFTFSQDSLAHSSQCEQESAGDTEQAQGRRRMLTQTSTPVSSVKQPADRQLSQTSRQPKPSRLQQPQARYRQVPDPTRQRLDVDETDDGCASEGSLYRGHNICKSSRIPVRDPTYPLLDTPTTTHRMPINQQQEPEHPAAYAHTTERDSGVVGSNVSWKSRRMGVRKEADVEDQENVVLGSVSVEGSPSQLAVHCGGSTTSEDKVEVTPSGGQTHPIPSSDYLAQRETDSLGHPIPSSGHLAQRRTDTLGHPIPSPSHHTQKETDTLGHPIPFSSHHAQRRTDTLGQPTEELAKGDDMAALRKQLTAVQEELRHLSSLQHPQAVIERKSSTSASSLPPSGCRQRTTAATARRGSSGNCSPAAIERVAMVTASPPHSRQDSQLPHVTDPHPRSVSSHQPEVHTTQREVHKPHPDVHTAQHDHKVHTAHPGVHTAHPGIHTAHPGAHTAHPGVHTAHPGVHTAHPGVHTAHPGVHTACPGAHTAHPGVHTAHPGVHTAHPGAHTAHPGVHTAHPRVHTSHPGVHTAHPGVHTAHIETSERDTSPMHATVITHGPDLLSPVIDRSTSPVYSETACSDTAPRMVSQGTSHEPPVGCVSNTVMRVTRGTDPEDPPTDFLVREKVAGSAMNADKQSYQQKKCGRLRHGTVARKRSVLSEQGGSASREALSSSEAETTPTKMSIRSPVGFTTESLNKEDLAKMYLILHKAGLHGPLTELTQDGGKVTDQAVQCNIDPLHISPDPHSGHGSRHSHWEVGGAQLHRTTLPLPRHMSTPHSKFTRERRHCRRDCSQTFCVTPPRHRSPDTRQPREPSDTGSCSSYSDALHSSSTTDSEPPTSLKVRRRKDIEFKDLTCGDCGWVERGCDLHRTRRCSRHAKHRPGNHRACPNHHSHHSCRKCNAYDCCHGSSRHRRHGHHSCRHTSPLSHKQPMEEQAPRIPNSVTVYGDTVLVSPSKLHTSSHPSSIQERPCPAMAAHQAPPSPPSNAYNESKLNEACRLAEKLKRHSRRMEWDLSLSIRRHCSHSFV